MKQHETLQHTLINPQCVPQIYLTLLWKKFDAFDSACSLRLGFILAIKSASKFFLILVFLGADSNTLQLKLCPTINAPHCPTS